MTRYTIHFIGPDGNQYQSFGSAYDEDTAIRVFSRGHRSCLILDIVGF